MSLVIPYQTDETKLKITSVPIPGAKATPATLNATASGNTAIVTPTSGKAIRVYYIHFSNRDTVNASPRVGLRFTTTGTIYFSSTLAATGMINANLLPHYWEGAVNEALYVNLSAAGNVDVTVLYGEF